jgi:hypothetical protein
MDEMSNIKILINLAAKRYCQQVLVLFLREFFQKNDSAPTFTWHNDPAMTKIMISSEYPEALIKLPCVIVGDITGDVYNRLIGQELITEHTRKEEIDGKVRDVVDKIITRGVYYLNCKVDVYSYKVSTRRFVADLVEAAFRHIGTDVLKPYGITINKVTMDSTTYRAVGNQMLQVSPISIGMVTEWHKEAVDFDTLRQILIKEIDISNTIN